MKQESGCQTRQPVARYKVSPIINRVDNCVARKLNASVKRPEGRKYRPFNAIDYHAYINFIDWRFQIELYNNNVVMKETQKAAETGSQLQLQGTRIQIENTFKRIVLVPSKPNLEKSPVVKLEYAKRQSGLEKQACKVKINRIDNVEVCNEQLRRIHETKQVCELSRLLELHTSNENSSEELELSSCDLQKYADLYEELYNGYYKELKEWDASEWLL